MCHKIRQDTQEHHFNVRQDTQEETEMQFNSFTYTSGIPEQKKALLL